jgi:hypothetical protein
VYGENHLLKRPRYLESFHSRDATRQLQRRRQKTELNEFLEIMGIDNRITQFVVETWRHRGNSSGMASPHGAAQRREGKNPERIKKQERRTNCGYTVLKERSSHMYRIRRCDPPEEKSRHITLPSMQSQPPSE